ncbi:MAG: MFS transporter [Gordonia sp. (in: high G+C Gram-positive bacteria)]|uniref:MFS transporter n=1 Tax=Gordonia sp. (in: high G+C Gram-positive bacteria) TaxID=84139 RepID=UPI0039E4DEE5
MRVVLGIGTCAGYPAAMHMIRAEGERTGLTSPATVLTALSITTQTVAVIGPTLGGLLISGWGWRASFDVNLPLGLLSAALGLLYLPRRTGLEPSTTDRPVIDWRGIGLFAISMIGLLIFLQNISIGLAWLAVAAAAVGGVFVWWELRADDPFLDLRVLAGNAPLLRTFARALLTAVVSYTFIYGFTQWLEDGRGLNAAHAGLVLLPIFATGIVFSAAFGRRPEVTWKLLVGSTAQLLASFGVLLLTGTSPVWFIVGVMIVVGIPQGLNGLAIQNSLYFQADPQRIASSAGLLRTFSYLGAITASVVYGNVYGARATTAGLHTLGWVVVAVSLLFFALTVFDRSLRRVGRVEPDDIAEARDRLGAAE